MERMHVMNVVSNVGREFTSKNNDFEAQRKIAAEIGDKLGNDKQQRLLSLGATWGTLPSLESKNPPVPGFICPIGNTDLVKAEILRAGYQIVHSTEGVDARSGDKVRHFYINE